MGVSGVLQNLADIVHLFLPVGAVFGCNLLKGLLSVPQGDLCCGRLFAGVNPGLWRLVKAVVKIIVFALPKIRNFQGPGKNGGNEERLINFIKNIKEQFVFFRICHAVLNKALSCAAVIGLAHIPGGGLVADTLPRSGQPLQELYKTGGVACLSLRVNRLDFLSGVHFQNHTGGHGLSSVGLQGAGLDYPANAAGGVIPLYGNAETGFNPLLYGNGGNVLVGIPDTGQGLAHVGHFPELGRAAFGKVKNHIIRLEKNRLRYAHTVKGILPYPIADRGVESVVLNAADHPVVLMLWGNLGGVQFVNLKKLQFEREDAAPGVPLYYQDAAVDLLAADRHPQNLVEALGAGHVAISLFGPNLPKPFDFLVEVSVSGFGL